MKKLIILLPLISILLCQSPSIAQGSFVPFIIHQTQLQNGLNVVTVPHDSPGIVAFYIVVRVGSRNEIEKGVTGFAHFFEHMMFRGTDRYPKDKYEQVLKSIGASANANTSSDRTVYHMTGDASKLEKMFEIEADRFRYLNYSKEDFIVEAGAVKGEYTKNYANPLSRLYESIRNTAFDIHTYKHTTMGFYEDIIDMPNQYEYSLQFYKRFYKPEYCTILCVGDVTHNQVVALSKKYFGTWERGSYIAEIPTEPSQNQTRYAHIKSSEIPPYLSLNYKGPAFSDSDIDLPALYLISSIYFGPNSNIYKKLVLEEKKLKSLGCYPSFNRDPELIGIYANLKDNKDLRYILNELLAVVETVKTKSLDPQVLNDAKSNIKYRVLMSMDNPTDIANILSSFISVSGDPESINRYYKTMERITSEDIITIARKYFVTTSLTIGTVTPDDNPDVTITK
ncbi:MAG: M16 family metallopeptidase [Ignavibacteria bacterium]